MNFRILAVGDVVGKPGLSFLRNNLSAFRIENKVDFIVVNGENAAETGKGLSPDDADAIFAAGADVITTGNHIFRRSNIYNYLDDKSAILRPANYSGECPGHGYSIENIGGVRVLCINVLGTVFLESHSSPFETVGAILKREEGCYDFSVCDIHAEATSEKNAFAYFFDGKIDFIFGTHTHIQTNDLRVLPGGTAFITDVGMTGPEDSVIGVKAAQSIKRFTTGMPTRYDVADGDCILCGAMVELDRTDSKVLSTKLIKIGGSCENS